VGPVSGPHRPKAQSPPTPLPHARPRQHTVYVCSVFCSTPSEWRSSAIHTVLHLTGYWPLSNGSCLCATFSKSFQTAVFCSISFIQLFASVRCLSSLSVFSSLFLSFSASLLSASMLKKVPPGTFASVLYRFSNKEARHIRKARATFSSLIRLFVTRDYKHLTVHPIAGHRILVFQTVLVSAIPFLKQRNAT